MKEPITYFLDHTMATVRLMITDRQLIVETRGKGVMDKPRIINILCSQVQNFCLVPVTKIQKLQGFKTQGDYSYDAEFIFTYNESGSIRNKRVFVNSRDESFIRLCNELKSQCPAASLLHLPQAEALKQMRLFSATKATPIILFILFGVPLLIALIYFLLKFS
ncbi:MAG TPA: hypothetical protein VF421_12735 [Niabella sp.]